jgi:hypothetical protein
MEEEKPESKRRRYNSSGPLFWFLRLLCTVAGEILGAEIHPNHCAHFCAHAPSKSGIIWAKWIAIGRKERVDKVNKG